MTHKMLAPVRHSCPFPKYTRLPAQNGEPFSSTGSPQNAAAPVMINVWKIWRVVVSVFIPLLGFFGKNLPLLLKSSNKAIDLFDPNRAS